MTAINASVSVWASTVGCYDITTRRPPERPTTTRNQQTISGLADHQHRTRTPPENPKRPPKEATRGPATEQKKTRKPPKDYQKTTKRPPRDHLENSKKPAIVRPTTKKFPAVSDHSASPSLGSIQNHGQLVACNGNFKEQHPSASDHYHHGLNQPTFRAYSAQPTKQTRQRLFVLPLSLSVFVAQSAPSSLPRLHVIVAASSSPRRRRVVIAVSSRRRPPNKGRLVRGGMRASEGTKNEGARVCDKARRCGP